MKELRVAKGTKFDTVIDSYMYAVVLAGGLDAYHSVGKTAIYLVYGDLLELIIAVAFEQGVHETLLKITPDEQHYLDSHEGAVLIEDDAGRVEVEWFTTREDAERHFEEFKSAKHVEVSSAVIMRAVDRMLVAEGEGVA